MQIVVTMHSRMKIMYLFQNSLIRFGLSIFGLSNLEILLMSHADYHQAIELIKISSMKLVRFLEEIYVMKLVRFQLASYNKVGQMSYAGRMYLDFNLSTFW
jgi:hypothetical protein